MHKFFSSIYLKNWQYDRMEDSLRFLLFIGVMFIASLMVAFGYLLNRIFDTDRISDYFQFFYILAMMALAALRIPYLQGHLERYRPESLKISPRNKTRETSIESPLAWKKPYLAVLGIANLSATPDEVKQAFRRLAMKYHPDHHGGQGEQFRKIMEAYKKLK